MNRTILITGVNGFVGKAIASNLSVDNHVIGIGRNSTNATGLDIEYYSVDISDFNSFDSIPNTSPIEVIVHCAAAISNDNMNPSLIDTNVRGVDYLMKFAKKCKCKKFVYISSLPIIGIPQIYPITEEHPVYPKSVYHLTKYFGELMIKSLSNDMDIVILRLPSPVGAEMPMNKIFTVFIKQCLNNEPMNLLGHGGRMQNYINVKDIANAARKAIKVSVTGVFNIAYTKSFTNLELAEICKNVLHSDNEIIFSGEDSDENIKWIYSIDKARRLLDFTPLISIEDSILEIANTMNL